MRRADRLFQIVLLFGRGKLLTASAVAECLEVSERTIYRDVQDLVGAGVPIEGEAGKGYRLHNGYQVPPMMFDDEELQALAFGAEVARSWGDQAMSDAAERILSKVDAVLPSRMRPKLALSQMYVPDFHIPEAVTQHLGQMRVAINKRRRLLIHYQDAKDEPTERIVWPLGLIYWGGKWTLGGWCELREDYRTFRIDRVQSARALNSPIPRTPERNLAEYLAAVSSNTIVKDSRTPQERSVRS